jgi:hypothetical protein
VRRGEGDARVEDGGKSVQGRLLIGPQVANLPHN